MTPLDSWRRVGISQLQREVGEFSGSLRQAETLRTLTRYLARNGGSKGAIHVGEAHGALHVRQGPNEVRIEKSGARLIVRPVPTGSLHDTGVRAEPGFLRFDGQQIEVPRSYRLHEVTQGVRHDRGLVVHPGNPTDLNERDLPVVRLDRDAGTVAVDGELVGA